MQLITLALVFGSLAIIAYAYAVYPLTLKLLSLFRVPATPGGLDGQWPTITIALPVHNEETTIQGALDALLTADYPPDRRQILVISDASTDGTDDLVRRYADSGVELVRLSTRGGKTVAENAACEHIRGDIVISTDASVRVHEHALRALVAGFSDPAVGVASGSDVSVSGDGGNTGESHYVGYEMWVRGLETAVGSIVGASGCLYASRAALYRNQLPEGLSRDFAAPLIARERGYRSIAVENALCLVPRTASPRQEYRRKVRTMTRGLQTLFHKRALLNPFRYGRFAWMLFSHKLVRWMVPWSALACLAGLAVLATTRPMAVWGLSMIAGIGVLALGGWSWSFERPTPRVLTVSSYVVFGALAGLAAWRGALRGELNAVWEPTSRPPVNAR
jgi:glycosyltransferase involved in cell wall biosynthesis